MDVDEAPPCECPVTAAERVISGKWTLLILRDLATGAQRFSMLERSLAGISTRTLSLRLKELETQGVIARAADDDGGCRGDYRLTEKGVELLPVIEAMRQWGERWGPLSDAVVETRRTTDSAVGSL